jgi:hypothetical protein
MLPIWSVGTLCIAAPAYAKLPPHSLEVSASRAFVGEPIEVALRFWDDRDHTRPADWPDLPRIRWVWAKPVLGSKEDRVSLVLRSAAPGSYTGTFVATEPGSWVVGFFEEDQPVRVEILAPVLHVPLATRVPPWAWPAGGVSLAALGALALRLGRPSRSRR